MSNCFEVIQRFFFVLWSFTLFVIGVALTVGAVCALVAGTQLTEAIVKSVEGGSGVEEQVQLLLRVLFAFGLVMAVIGALGVYGVFISSPIVLGFHVIFVCLIVLAKIALLIYVQQNQEAAINFINKHDATDLEVRREVAAIEKDLDCCGFTKEQHEEYKKAGLCEVPKLLYDGPQKNMFTDCVSKWKPKLTVVLVLSFVVVLFDFVYLIVAISLCREFSRRDYTRLVY